MEVTLIYADPQCRPVQVRHLEDTNLSQLSLSLRF